MESMNKQICKLNYKLYVYITNRLCIYIYILLIFYSNKTNQSIKKKKKE